ncbi:MAG: trypsin-like peptidase domain-containing protein [Xanthomonadales bacterium]|nr:trypsin-like peptidase domain-containing protein [Xanthomonadales bacterium]
MSAAWRTSVFCAWALLAPAISAAQAQAPAAAPAEANHTPAAEQVFADVRSALLQIRTLVAANDQQSSIGSGFLVSEDGLAVTNYHVVSQFALEPSAYRLRFLREDGSEGDLELLAIDVAADLAVVRLAGSGLPHLQFDERAVHDELEKGERLFSIGNPLDLGFTIVEGNHNGRVEKSYVERLHFSGAINPGMSGGPTLTRDKRVAGVNVSKLLSGDLVSFLVPARFAAALVERARSGEPMSLDAVRAEIQAQMLTWQESLYAQLADLQPERTVLGPYQVAESRGPWFSCWARTNEDVRPVPRVLEQTSQCAMQNWIFIAGDLDTGLLQRKYTYLKSRKLNATQFAAYLTRHLRVDAAGSRRLTAPRCEDSFVAVSEQGPELKVVWCARAYKEFDGLYDVEMVALTREGNEDALLAQLSMRGAGYANALAEARRMLEEIRWKP